MNDYVITQSNELGLNLLTAILIVVVAFMMAITFGLLVIGLYNLIVPNAKKVITKFKNIRK